jgi:hypothetical protein
MELKNFVIDCECAGSQSCNVLFEAERKSSSGKGLNLAYSRVRDICIRARARIAKRI